jgi:glycosyltransferase involved in cell wall biosynthesis|tara:strand:+ start:240 stop:2354 length:2115 start_codon:yes stop_codon:yes gene_type:complete
LPYKENFSPTYAGAVSLNINETLKISRYRKNTTVFGNTEYRNKFKHKYVNIPLQKRLFQSLNKKYVEEFIKLEKKKNSDLIELHNRPIYLSYLTNKLKNKTYILYFHNDPLTMSGSKSIHERIFLLKNCFKIIFNSNWSKRRFLEGMKSDYINSEKLIVINQSAKKNKIDLNKKKKIITFVGKLNKSKGYDLFGKAIVKILHKYKDWTSIVIGDEPRDQLKFNHKNLIKLGFKKHKDVLNIYKKSTIAVVCSRWEEPFGRTSLEAASNGCAVIISNRGGLPETITNGIILKKLDVGNIYKEIKYLIKNAKQRKKLQQLSLKNFFLTHQFVSKLIDQIRDQKFLLSKKINSYPEKKSLRILHITNFNERHNGRLFFNTGRRINNGFIRLGNSVLEFSDRDIQKHYKTYTDISGAKSLNEKLKKTCYNYKPDLVVLGHADLISSDMLGELKDEYPYLKIAQWFLDPLNKNGPDYLKNKNRILNKSEFLDANFITTSPDVLNFLPKNVKNYFIPNPSDLSFETLNNYKYDCTNDVFFALSHGVHRGSLKSRTFDDREVFIKKLIEKSKDIKFDIFGINKVQPIWADQYFKTISNSKMGLNLSRGLPIKYYSSDRITQITGNGLVTLIDEKTGYRDFFNDKEMIFYKNLSDLSEKISKICQDEKLRKSIGKNGKEKYLKYFNSSLVAEFIINKSFDINNKNYYLWHNR